MPQQECSSHAEEGNHARKCKCSPKFHKAEYIRWSAAFRANCFAFSYENWHVTLGHGEMSDLQQEMWTRIDGHTAILWVPLLKCTRNAANNPMLGKWTVLLAWGDLLCFQHLQQHLVFVSRRGIAMTILKDAVGKKAGLQRRSFPG